MSDTIVQPAVQPHPSVAQLEAFAGTWELRSRDLNSGEESVTRMRREMMPGGFYLVEHVEGDTPSGSGAHYVGYDSTAGHLRSLYFSADGPGPFGGGFALEYVWELNGEDITIWCGGIGSPARYTGRFSADGTQTVGRWEWPGGGYEAIETRV